MFTGRPYFTNFITCIHFLLFNFVQKIDDNKSSVKFDFNFVV